MRGRCWKPYTLTFYMAIILKIYILWQQQNKVPHLDHFVSSLPVHCLSVCHALLSLAPHAFCGNSVLPTA